LTNLTQTAPDTIVSAKEGVTITTLPNGLRVVSAVRPTPGEVQVTVYTKVGARNETSELNGITHYLEHVLFKGTKHRNVKEIAEQIEVLGGYVNAATGKAATSYLVEGLSEHMEKSVEILADIVCHATFPMDEIEREKGVVCEEIAEYGDKISHIARAQLDLTAYGNTPLGREILGTSENVMSFTQDDLFNYVKTFYHPEHMLLIAAGDVDHDALVAMGEKYFGHLERAPAVAIEPAQYVGGVTIHEDDRFEQSHMYVAFPAPGSIDLSLTKYAMLANVLGGGMSSPLFQNTRERKALCYSVGSGLLRNADLSLFVIKGSASTGNVVEFLKTAISELVRIAQGEVTEADWTRSRNQIILQQLSQNRNPDYVTDSVATQLFAKGEAESDQVLLDRYRSVTRDEVIEAAQELLSSISPTLVVAGGIPEGIDFETLFTDALHGAYVEETK
jgi:predicted Zn-dependent peptidase